MFLGKHGLRFALAVLSVIAGTQGCAGPSRRPDAAATDLSRQGYVRFIGGGHFPDWGSLPPELTQRTEAGPVTIPYDVCLRLRSRPLDGELLTPAYDDRSIAVHPAQGASAAEVELAQALAHWRWGAASSFPIAGPAQVCAPLEVVLARGERPVVRGRPEPRWAGRSVSNIPVLRALKSDGPLGVLMLSPLLALPWDAPFYLSHAKHTSGRAIGELAPLNGPMPQVMINVAIASREEPHFSKEYVLKNAREITGAGYIFSVASDGGVANVEPLIPVPTQDERILAVLRRWRFQPTPTPYRVLHSFIWVIER